MTLNLIKWLALKHELELMIDQCGLAAVLGALDSVCLEKADWVESPESIGTPDKNLARAWRSCAAAISRVPTSGMP